jgi:hypothetical protein
LSVEKKHAERYKLIGYNISEPEQVHFWCLIYLNHDERLLRSHAATWQLYEDYSQ